jgi:hypothetical protein
MTERGQLGDGQAHFGHIEIIGPDQVPTTKSLFLSMSDRLIGIWEAAAHRHRATQELPTARNSVAIRTTSASSMPG